MDDRSERIAQQVKSALRSAFGERLVALYAFGSRVRGDHHEESDLDLVVVLKNPRHPLVEEDCALVDVVYPIELETGMVIHAWSLPANAMTSGDTFRAQLVEAIRREGLLI